MKHTEVQVGIDLKKIKFLNGKIKQFKKILKKVGFDGYVVPKNDEFFCEYIENYNDRLKYISNFSGSYGIALILKK